MALTDKFVLSTPDSDPNPNYGITFVFGSNVEANNSHTFATQ